MVDGGDEGVTGGTAVVMLDKLETEPPVAGTEDDIGIVDVV